MRGADRRNSTGGLGAEARRSQRKRRADERPGATPGREDKAVEFNLPNVAAADVGGSGAAGGPAFAPCG